MDQALMLCRRRCSHLLQFSRANRTVDNRWTPAPIFVAARFVVSMKRNRACHSVSPHRQLDAS
jgi:hypothetical protein